MVLKGKVELTVELLPALDVNGSPAPGICWYCGYDCGMEPV
jgi:hypothetical protein